MAKKLEGVSKVMSKLAKRRWKNVSKKDRIAHARKMNEKRWPKKV